jgi:hypothetical protein
MTLVDGITTYDKRFGFDWNRHLRQSVKNWRTVLRKASLRLKSDARACRSPRSASKYGDLLIHDYLAGAALALRHKSQGLCLFQLIPVYYHRIYAHTGKHFKKCGSFSVEDSQNQKHQRQTRDATLLYLVHNCNFHCHSASSRSRRTLTRIFRH